MTLCLNIQFCGIGVVSLRMQRKDYLRSVFIATKVAVYNFPCVWCSDVILQTLSTSNCLKFLPLLLLQFEEWGLLSPFIAATERALRGRSLGRAAQYTVSGQEAWTSRAGEEQPALTPCRPRPPLTPAGSGPTRRPLGVKRVQMEGWGMDLRNSSALGALQQID